MSCSTRIVRIRRAQRAGEQRVGQHPQVRASTLEVYTSACASSTSTPSCDREHAALGRLQRPRARRARRSPRLARPGQFVMVKPSRGIDPLLRRPFSVFEILRDGDGAADRHLDPQQARRRRHASALRRGAGRARRVPRPARPSVRAGRSAGARRGWSPAASASRRSSTLAEALAGRGDADDALLRRAPRARPATTSTSSNGSASTSCSRPRTAAAARTGFITAPLERGARRASAPAPAVHALRLRPDADDARRRRRSPRARPAVRRLARTGHGLRPRRLLQLRRPRPAQAGGAAALRALVHRRAGLRRGAHRLGAWLARH